MQINRVAEWGIISITGQSMKIKNTDENHVRRFLLRFNSRFYLKDLYEFTYTFMLIANGRKMLYK